MATQWRDDGFRYGAVTRALHWAIALLLTWQFTGMAVKLIVGKAPITAFWVGTHKGIGVVLLTLIVLPALYARFGKVVVPKVAERPREPGPRHLKAAE
jgi:cytochrome b561